MLKPEHITKRFLKAANEGSFFIRCVTHTLKLGDRPNIWGYMCKAKFEDTKKAFEEATVETGVHKFMFVYRVEKDHKMHLCAIWANELGKFITAEEYIKSIK